ncbi:GPO family capsid scaffolding protein [Aeromonas hydrophila]|uniref:GPO family capsid scaffolding protein n=1 Tax=Aeromonas hydrophila TaxID=644 RepID=UPI001F3505EF|nr:GPO family capsid scaffolding protein [Aeromonas hydrophila]
MLATHFAINPYCPLCYSNQQPILSQQTLRPTIRLITPPSSGPTQSRVRLWHPVQTLKTEEVNDKLKLFAILCPNRDLISYNQSGQYQFCSIEPIEQSADLERIYLLGLGVTDEPNPRIRKGNQNGSIRCWGPSMALAPRSIPFLVYGLSELIAARPEGQAPAKQAVEGGAPLVGAS